MEGREERGTKAGASGRNALAYGEQVSLRRE